MERVKIVVLDGAGVNPGDLSWEALELVGDCTIHRYSTQEQVEERAQGAQIVLTNKVHLKANFFESLPELRYVGVFATGYNIVDVEAAARCGVVVSNVPAYSTRSVAQMALSHLLNITLQVGHHSHEVKAKGRWARCEDFCFWDTPLIELDGLTFGVVGFGSTGSATAAAVRALGMRVIAYTSKTAEELPEWVESVPLDTLFERADVVSLHAPLTPTTRNLVDARRLALMKKSAILINTSRGPLVDEQALSDALHAGQIYAAGVDVLSTEPPMENNPLLSAPRCYITPHIAWATFAARERLLAQVIANLKAFLSGEPINVVS